MLKGKEYVYAVYTEKSFSKAAEKLFISQPALSSAVKKIEKKIGMDIFNRSTAPISLTPAGVYYIECAEKLMTLENEMSHKFKEIENSSGISLKIGSSAFFCTHILPKFIEKFYIKHPNYYIDLSEANATVLKNGLKDGSFDITFDVEQCDNSTQFSKVIHQEHILLAVPKDFEINQTLKDFRLSFNQVRNGEYLNFPSVNMENFANQPFLMLKNGNDLYTRGMALCSGAGFQPKVVMYIDQLLTSYYIACSGTGLVFLRAGITSHVEQTDKLYFYRINDAIALRNIYLTCNKSAFAVGAVTDFFDFLSDPKEIEQVFGNHY